MNRLSYEEALNLLKTGNLAEIGIRADAERARRHGLSAFLVRDVNLNYSKRCIIGCRFCSFHTSTEAGAPLTTQELIQTLEPFVEVGATQILLQGGIDPLVNLEQACLYLSAIREKFPQLFIHAYSPVEIDFWARSEKKSEHEILKHLIKAGMNALPGGGAEVLSPRFRSEWSPRKTSAERWLAIAEIAHSLGIRGSATLMMGAGESDEEIISHLDQLRNLQDRTGGFTAFIPWTYCPHPGFPPSRNGGGLRYLKVLGVSRLFLDNFDHIQLSWLTQGPRMAQVALAFGADDFGSVLLDESVVKSTKTGYSLIENSILQIIAEAKRIPVYRNGLYQVIAKDI